MLLWPAKYPIANCSDRSVSKRKDAFNTELRSVRFEKDGSAF